MLSRVANSIYWMARYVERAENLARFVDVNLSLMLDQPAGTEPQWQPLVAATGESKAFAERYGEATPESVVQFLTFDRKYPSSMLASLEVARENARTVREAISSEAWEQLNEFYHFVRAAERDVQRRDALSEFYQSVKQHSHLFSGVLDATMSHGEGWHFANLGRLLERADMTSRILDVKYFTLLPRIEAVGTTVDDLQWSAVLRSVSGFEVYRKRHHAITIERIVGFLVLDNEFPRAIHACVTRADESLHRISGSPVGSYRNAAEQSLGRLRSELDYSDVATIVGIGLHEFIDGLQTRLNRVDENVRSTFFAPRPAAVQTQRAWS